MMVATALIKKTLTAYPQAKVQFGFVVVTFGPNLSFCDVAVVFSFKQIQ